MSPVNLPPPTPRPLDPRDALPASPPHPAMASLAQWTPRINAALAQACQFGDGCPARLADAIAYAVMAPGKRLRPYLVLAAADACGGDWQAAMPAAVAVEMIHAYSLIHDDLPAMDDDDLRRGRPTTHIAFDEATAILAGDALQSEAFAHLHRHVADGLTAAALIGELAVASGATGLVGGQCDDLAAEHWTMHDVGGPAAAFEVLQSIHRRKTGALFAASVRMGAIAAGGGDEERRALTRYADAFGLAFQITDDLLDVTASDEQLGKRAQKDAQRGKFTYPAVLTPGVETSVSPGGDFDQTTRSQEGIRLAREHAGRCVRDARTAVELFGNRAGRLIELADFVLERQA